MSVTRKKMSVLRKYGDDMKGTATSDEAYLSMWTDYEDLAERVNDAWDDYSDDDKRAYLSWVGIKASVQNTLPQLVTAGTILGGLGRKKVSDLIGLILLEITGEDASAAKLTRYRVGPKDVSDPDDYGKYELK